MNNNGEFHEEYRPISKYLSTNVFQLRYVCSFAQLAGIGYNSGSIDAAMLPVDFMLYGSRPNALI